MSVSHCSKRTFITAQLWRVFQNEMAISRWNASEHAETAERITPEMPIWIDKARKSPPSSVLTSCVTGSFGRGRSFNIGENTSFAARLMVSGMNLSANGRLVMPLAVPFRGT